MSKPIIIGHRGAAGEAPENTLASFLLAMEQGSQGLELDVHLSADGEIVVCHDSTVDRTTDGSGRIQDMTLAQLKRLDAGRWFHERFAGERIPLLQEVFHLVPGSVMINIEVKQMEFGGTSSAVLNRLVHLMLANNRMENVVVSSFDLDFLSLLKQLEPAVNIGLLYSTPLSPVVYRNGVLHRKVPVYSLHPHYNLINSSMVAEAKQYGVSVFPWTLNGVDVMRRSIEARVSGIITDYPGRLRTLLENET